MDARLRESFLRELMILQSSPMLSADQQQQKNRLTQELSVEPSQQSSSITTNVEQAQRVHHHQLEQNTRGEKEGGICSKSKRARKDPGSSTAPSEATQQSHRQVEVTLFDESGSTGRTLSALFVACDTNLTHLLLNDLKTPIGIQPSALSINTSSAATQATSTNNIHSRAGAIVDRAITNANTQGRRMSEKPFAPRKALVLRKFSRLEYERSCHPNLSEEQLANNLRQRGSAYESLKHYDSVQKTCLQQIESTLASNDIDYQTVDKFGYTEEKINWADVIITSGGDGTFLMAASKVTTRDKPVIGINSDPTKSVGHLCLPSKFSNNFDEVIEFLRSGKFQWQYKQRLRVTLIGEAAVEEPKQLNDIRCDMQGYIDQDLDQDRCQQQQQHQQNNTPNHTNHNHAKTYQDSQQTNSNNITVSTVDGKVTNKFRRLKERALNEVFVGETLSARVSYYELSVDNNKLMKMKSSGLTVCTGTGSTSWYYNINKVTEQQVNSIVRIINKVTGNKPADKVNANETTIIGDITRQFNATLTFAPTEPIMAYSIRDPIGYANALSHSHRGHAKRIEVKSRMQNACLVLDGCQFYPFNDGSYALIEVHDEDALKTVSIE